MNEHGQKERRRNESDRRSGWALSEAEIEIIVERVASSAAERAADLVFARIYGEVGKGVLKRLAQTLIVGSGLFAAWLAGKGYWK